MFFLVAFPKMRFGSRRLLRQRGPPQSPLRCGKASPLTSVAFRLGYFTKSVILSGVTAERSEAVTQSKEPMPACGSTGTARHCHDASVRSTVRTPCGVRGACDRHGVLRLASLAQARSPLRSG